MTYVIVISEMGVGNGDGGGALDDVDEAVGTFGHGDMINPHILCAVQAYSVSVGLCPQPYVVVRVPD